MEIIAASDVYQRYRLIVSVMSGVLQVLEGDNVTGRDWFDPGENFVRCYGNEHSADLLPPDRIVFLNLFGAIAVTGLD
jgi:hypothetical protein